MSKEADRGRVEGWRFWLWAPVVVLVVIAVGVVYSAVLARVLPELQSRAWLGDSLAPIATVVSALALVAIIQQLWLQQKQIAETRKTVSEQAAEQQETRATLERMACNQAAASLAQLELLRIELMTPPDPGVAKSPWVHAERAKMSDWAQRVAAELRTVIESKAVNTGPEGAQLA